MMHEDNRDLGYEREVCGCNCCNVRIIGGHVHED
jgi:hypothetical protein